MEDTGVKRKLTVILAADFEGYSRLMGADEEATHKTLRAYREIIDGLIARHDGRVFSTAGDSVVAELGSAVEAVRCAISIQEELRVRNAELAEDRQMLLRIGINVGDVMIDDDDLFGDGINVAARLEGLAEPGSICISGSTFEQVKNKLSFGFEDMGLQEVKNIPYKVPAFRIKSGPISVTTDAPSTSADTHVRAWSSNAKGSRRLAISTAVITLAIGVGAMVWVFYPREPVSLSSFPSHIAVEEMRASEVEVFMSGMTVQGILKRSGRPFTIKVNPDKTAIFSFSRGGSQGGTTFRAIGQWWAEDYRFCWQFPNTKFAGGRRVCPRISKEGNKIRALHRDGTFRDWTFFK